MDRRGIVAAGNWLVDLLRFIPSFPEEGSLVSIERESVGLGGCAHNVIMDLARMHTDIPLYAAGCVGKDTYGDMILEHIDRQGINRDNVHRLEGLPTSYTDVMVARDKATRTFFHNRGANAAFGVDEIERIDVPARIFHLGYLLLLDKLEEPDDTYGLKAARALHDLRQKGYETSVDIVSEESDRFQRVVLPCLPYVDYLILNEVEAGACYGVSMRDERGEIRMDRVRMVAADLMAAGIQRLCCIHFPEGGYALDREGEACFCPSFAITPQDIVSTVGAGDAFCAGILYAVHERMPLPEMVRFANASAYFNLLHDTSCGGAPELREIKDFMNQNKICHEKK